MPQYLLLDGAQLETKSGLAQIISNHRCCHVYERLGATAAAVGPIVVEPDADLLDAARTWEQTAPRSHAVGHIGVRPRYV